jgi:hypothetical protein
MLRRRALRVDSWRIFLLSTVLGVLVGLVLVWAIDVDAHELTPDECVGQTMRAIGVLNMRGEPEFDVAKFKRGVIAYYKEKCSTGASDCWDKDDEDLNRSLAMLDLVAKPSTPERVIGEVYQVCMEQWRAGERKRKSF